MSLIEIPTSPVTQSKGTEHRFNRNYVPNKVMLLTGK